SARARTVRAVATARTPAATRRTVGRARARRARTGRSRARGRGDTACLRASRERAGEAGRHASAPGRGRRAARPAAGSGGGRRGGGLAARRRIARRVAGRGPVARRGGAAVGLVEAAALERDADGREDLLQRARAGGAGGEGCVGEGLDHLVELPAVGAAVFVRGHLISESVPAGRPAAPTIGS